MKTLVIGHTSFIARHLCQHSEAKDWFYVSHNDAFEDETWSIKPDCVVNLAIDSAVKQGQYSDLDLRIGQKAQECGAHFIALSSRTVYGIPQGQRHHVFIEDQEFLDSSTPYGAGKRSIERSLIETLAPSKLTILRPSNIFGFEYEKNKPRSTFFGQMLKSLKEHEKINFDMAAQTKRDFLPVDNFVDILVRIIKNPNQGVYNIGSGSAVSCETLAQSVIQGFESGTLYIDEDASIIDSFELNIEKLQQDYSFEGISEDNILEECVKIGKQLKDL